jgi:hypothetical protein
MSSAADRDRAWKPFAVPLVVAGLGSILGGVGALALAHNNSHAKVPLAIVILVFGVVSVSAGVTLLVRRGA